MSLSYRPLEKSETISLDSFMIKLSSPVRTFEKFGKVLVAQAEIDPRDQAQRLESRQQLGAVVGARVDGLP